MPSDAARQPRQPAPIAVPDQLQQAQRPPAPQPSGATRAVPRAEPPRAAGGVATRDGVLGQLETERAHD